MNCESLNETILRKLVWFFIFACVIRNNCYGQDFGYDGDEGPDFWGDSYDTCLGKHQSPINVIEKNVRMFRFPELFFLNFDEPLQGTIVQNNGHTVMVSVSKGRIPKVYGGPLKGVYAFQQLHFHWGHNDTEGSENLINDESFPLELHIVFYKLEYKTYANAQNHNDGLVVLSFLYTLADEENHIYDQFQSALPNVYSYNSTTEIYNFVPLDKFTQNDKSRYFAYIGSLTTPPCSEIVIWLEFKDTIPLSHAQIHSFRSISGSHGNLTHNFRPTQAIYDRIIYMNSGMSMSVNKCISIVQFILIWLFIN